MSKEVPWSKIILEEFIKEALLSKEEEWIMRTRCADGRGQDKPKNLASAWPHLTGVSGI